MAFFVLRIAGQAMYLLGETRKKLKLRHLGIILTHLNNYTERQE